MSSISKVSLTVTDPRTGKTLVAGFEARQGECFYAFQDADGRQYASHVQPLLEADRATSVNSRGFLPVPVPDAEVSFEMVTEPTPEDFDKELAEDLWHFLDSSYRFASSTGRGNLAREASRLRARVADRLLRGPAPDFVDENLAGGGGSHVAELFGGNLAGGGGFYGDYDKEMREVAERLGITEEEMNSDDMQKEE